MPFAQIQFPVLIKTLELGTKAFNKNTCLQPTAHRVLNREAFHPRHQESVLVEGNVCVENSHGESNIHIETRNRRRKGSLSPTLTNVLAI